MARSSRLERISCVTSSDMPTGMRPAMRSPRRRFWPFWQVKDRSPGIARTSITPLPASGAMRSAVILRRARRSRTRNRNRPSDRRRISTRMTSCGGSLIPATVESSRRGAMQLDAVTFRTLLLLLYGAGLRFSEATGLTLANVDLAEAVVTIRATKFYKSRLVPIGPQLADGAGELHASAAARRACAARDVVPSGEPGRHAGSPAAPFRPHSTRCGVSPGSIARQAGDRSRACMISGTASRFTA